MQRRAHAAGVRYLVVMLPTKELVFQPRARSVSASYTQLMHQEEEFRRMLRSHLQANGVDFIDPLPALRRQFDAGVNPYQNTDDGHPSAAGHRAIAELLGREIASRLQRAP